MDADFVAVEEAVEQPYGPVGGGARADMGQNLAPPAGEVFRADGRYRTGTHIGQRGGVQQSPRNAGCRVEQRQHADLRRQVLLVVVDIVADDLDPGIVDPAADITAQYVEMAVELRV